ncbi:MAG: uroporphyrinogen decarboxylase family protein, partial [Clostridiales bacterium]
YDNICYNSGPVFSPKMYRQIFLPWEKQVAQACRLPWVCHMDGNISKIIEDMLTLGMSGLHPIEPEPGLGLSEMKQRYGKQVCLWGNVDLQYILPYGTEAETIADVQRCLRQGGAGGGYIIGSSNGLPNYCKTANILAMASAIAEYGWYPLSSQQQ